ncbi:hypothetical protein ACFE33_09690 [Falsihalocynthiibacter sp. SS001]|uniref:hypothetical protein n=1 Tax=Falsihalocynthiibacter sp. SS001 TaxID=3349698 RepID=UPI0036D20DCD
MTACLATFGAAPALAEGFWDKFIDPDDNMLDLSQFLQRGGFVPLPVIITEPAVENGLGAIGQFVNGDPRTDNLRRTIIGGALTGNGSYGLGAMQAGVFNGGRTKYAIGLGGANMNLPIYPFGSSQSVEYNNQSGGIFANLRTQIGDSPWYFGPNAQYRFSKLSLNADGKLGELTSRFRTDNHYAALGVHAVYDTLDNSVSPLEGANAVIQYNVFSEAIGSDKDFEIGSVALHAFHKFSDNSWSLGAMTRYDWSGGDTPFFMAPQVNLRGISYGRYSGDQASSTEIQLRKQFNDRWAGVAFAGYGKSFAGNSKLFEDSGGISTYGVGFRYKIAKALGIDMGIDIARGPDETIWSIQFGHAWGRTMK